MKFQIITPDVKLGQNVKIYEFVNLYGCEIGENTKIGAFVEIGFVGILELGGATAYPEAVTHNEELLPASEVYQGLYATGN